MYVHTYIHTYIHHITSHHITSHHITLHHITLHHITSHYITLHHITLHYIPLRKYVQIYVYTHIYIYMYIHTYTYACIYTRTYTYLRTSVSEPKILQLLAGPRLMSADVTVFFQGLIAGEEGEDGSSHNLGPSSTSSQQSNSGSLVHPGHEGFIPSTVCMKVRMAWPKLEGLRSSD